MSDLQGYVEELGKAAKRASQRLVSVKGAVKTAALRQMSMAIRQGRSVQVSGGFRE